MDLSVLKILAIINVFLFFIFMFITKKDKNRLFIKFVLLTYPLMSINIYGELSSFDSLCILFFLFFYKMRLTEHKISIFYTVIFFIYAVSVFWGIVSADFKIDIASIHLFISVLTIFFFSKLLIDECLFIPDLFYSIIHYLKIMLVFSFIFLIIQFFIGPQFSLSNYQNPNIVSSEGIRYPSFLSDPQVYSQFLGSIGFVSLINVKKNKGFHSNKYVLSILCMFGILIAGGRAGLLGLFTGFAFLLLFSNWNFRFSFIFLAISLYFIVIFFFNEMIIFKRGTNLNDAYVFRNSVWKDAFKIFSLHPFFGIGMGNYTNYVAIHNPDQVWLRDNEYITFDHPESGYLKILSETGILGFTCFALLFINPILNGIKHYIFKKDNIVILLISALICWLVGFYSTFSLGETRLKILVVTILSLLIVRLSLLNSNRVNV